MRVFALMLAALVGKTHADTCSSMHDTQCSTPNTDIDYHTGVWSHEQCCALCQQSNRGCKAWSWQFSEGHCHLHSSCDKIYNTLYHSGILGSGPSPSPPPSPGGNAFWVAEVKPHFDCNFGSGQSAVTTYVDGLVRDNYGIIALIQYEFRATHYPGYQAFGAACVDRYADAAVVLVQTSMFDYVKGFVDTSTTMLPYIGGWTPDKNHGKACLGDVKQDGERAYTGARLRHKSSGTEFCVIAATLPHFGRPAGSFFENELRTTCGNVPKLLIMDTNDQQPMTNKGASVAGGWGSCSDLGQNGPRTCCNDKKEGYPYARYTYDRTAMCGGGSIAHWEVNSQFVCGADEEHLFTRAQVVLPGSMHQTNVTVIV